MQTYSLVERGQLCKFTTNAVDPSGSDTFKIYKITEDNQLVDITPDDVSISDLGNNIKRVELNAPDEDCYIFSLFNQEPLFLRVGVPTLRAFFYAGGKEGLSINYKYLDFEGNELDSGTLEELSNGIYYYTPDDAGDNIILADGFAPAPLHVPYVVDRVGMSGKIRFEKDRWMLLAIPKKGTKIADVAKEVADKYGVNPDDLFRVFNAYPSTNSQYGEFLSYVPGVTSSTSKHNFSLVYKDTDDNGNTIYEITGFWCKTKNYDIGDDVIAEYEWHA